MWDLTQGNITFILLRFSLPIVFSRVFQLCYSIVDTRIVGDVLGDSSLAAIGASATFYQLLLTFITGLTAGFAIVIARYFGAKEETPFRRSVASTFWLGMLLCVGLTAWSLLCLPMVLQMLQIEDALWAESNQYIQIVLWGLLFAALYNLCSGVLYGVGDSLTPLLFLMMSTIGNIGLDILLVVLWPFGVAGAAAGTVLAQGVAAVGCLIYMWIRYPSLRLHREDFALDATMIKNLLCTGISCAFMQSMIALGSFTLQITINSLGETYIVAQTAARRISEILMMPFLALASAMGTFTSQNLGSRKLQRIREGYRQSILLLWGWCVIVVGIAYMLSPWLVALITATESDRILQAASWYLKIDTLFYATLPLIIVSRQVLQSLGDAVIPVISSGIECVGKMVIAFTLAKQLGYFGIILAEPIVWFLMVIPLLYSIKQRMPKKDC